MHKKLHLLLIVCFCLAFASGNAQDDLSLQAIVLDSVLTNDANAIVRSEEVVVELLDSKSFVVRTKRVVTVLNKLGKAYADSYERYDPHTKIRKLQATVYNVMGVEIKKYKKNDFDDRSAYSGGSLAIDDRIKYFEYTPTAYPYTIVFESEVESQSTAFLPKWKPILTYNLSVEKSSYSLLKGSEIKLRFKEENFQGYPIEIDKSDAKVRYILENIPAIKYEEYGPSLYDVVPVLRIVPTKFTLKGVEGEVNDWKTFGKWYNDNLLVGKTELPQKTIEEINFIVEKAETDLQKTKLIYEYVQNKTRYISVQLGIGGWEPFSAIEVDGWGYGDCKALSNYTKALLNSQGIKAYHTVLFGSKHNIINIDQEFASVEGNHMILNVPNEEGDIWLECTSQTSPFNFIAGFTDDRDVLVITPEGGQIKHTKKYSPEENSLYSSGAVSIQPDGSLRGSIEMSSGGVQYNQRYGIQSKPEKDQKIYYKNYWNYINGLNLTKIIHQDNKEQAIFLEKIDVNASNYATKAGSRLLVNPNIFNRYTAKLPKYKDRQMPLDIPRGYLDTDEYTIQLPTGHSVQSIPEKKVIETEFGRYSWGLEKISDSQLKFKRELKVESGTYPKEKYEAYRQFIVDVKKADASKIIVKQL